MQVTRALEYANRAMVLLAAHQGRGPMLVNDIARLTAAPPNFLHQVLNTLARGGLLVCRRGTQRGYELARPPERISLLDVFEVVEGPLGLTSCTVEGQWCPREKRCSLSSVWHDVQDAILERLRSATLDRLSAHHSIDDGCPIPVS